MKQAISTFIISIISLNLFGCQSGKSKSNQSKNTEKVDSNYALLTYDIEGYWEVKDYMFLKGSSLDSLQAKALQKQSIFISKDSAFIFDDTLFATNYKFERVNANNEIWQNYKKPKETFNIHSDSIVDVTIDYTMRSGNSSVTGFYLNDTIMILGYEGLLIHLVKKSKLNLHTLAGTGSTIKEFSINGETKAKFSYEFYKDADQLSVEDQDGRELFVTETISTNGEQNAIISLLNVSKLIFKIKSSSPNSRWKLKVEY